AGRRMFAANDPTPSGTPTPTPTPTATATPTATPTPTPTVTPGGSGGPQCALPGISVQTDASGDTGTGTLGTVPGTPAQDITDILFAEPSQSDGIPRLAVTMKASDLTALPTNGLWHVYFKVGTTTYFTSVFNNPISGLQYEYGHVGTGSDTTDGDADGGSVSTANNTITVFVANSKAGSPGVGTMLTGIYGRTITLVG